MFLIELKIEVNFLENNTVLLHKSHRKDFQKTKYFPGTIGNPFDLILRKFNQINEIHPIVFFLLMIFLSGIISIFRADRWIILMAAVLLDWLIIWSLPKLLISFGPLFSQIFLLFILRSVFIWMPYPINLILEIIGTLLVFIGFVVEPSSIKVTKYNYSSKKINFPTKIKFLQIGDIHLEKHGRRETRLISEIAKLKPQFILFTGDFLNLSFNQNKESIGQVISLINEINEIAPTYFVNGSPAVDLKESLKEIEAFTNAIYIKNDIFPLKIDGSEINLIGIQCSHIPSNDYAQLKKIRTHPELFNILMYHSPDLIFELDPDSNIDLMVSGHTHGGQVRIPFFGAVISASLYGRKLQYGLYKLESTILSITRGIGLEGMGAPRVRFLCKPEIIEWTLLSG
ncbi:MAG: hypothetical protein CVU46_16245 [Chloroflexi bacterium HGW-Chloroflexi-8]|nr:MAG: hypothetical protein CVU46_16245 [Chloroflexi bacterium HGW-Chloroflexi-8]